jgi:hypothetical protein
MPKSLTFLTGMNKGDAHHWEFPTFQVVINVLNNAVLQEILKVPGVELIDLNRIATNRPPVVDVGVDDGIQASGPPRSKATPKGNPNPTPYHDRFKHPSGKPASWFLLKYMSDNGGKGGLAELKRHLKTQGFVPSTAQGAMSKLAEKGKVKKAKGGGYILVDVEKVSGEI